MDREWLIPNLRCPSCGAVEEGIRLILSTESGDRVGYLIVCTNCHIMLVSDMDLKEFNRMMNTPPNETSN